MSVGLLDINVLIALAWPAHVHHAPAHDWFLRHHHHGWATCPLTQLRFVRISSNPRIILEAVSPRQALKVLGGSVMRQHDGKSHNLPSTSRLTLAKIIPAPHTSYGGAI